MPYVVVIVGGMVVVYLGTNIVATFAVALLTLSGAAIAGVIGLKFFGNLRGNCDLLSMKKCKR